GRRSVMLAFMSVYLIGSIAAAFAPNIDILIAARFLQGVGAAAGMVISRAVIRDLFDDSRSAGILNLMGIILAAGPAFAPTIGGLTMAVAGWHMIFLIMVALGALT